MGCCSDIRIFGLSLVRPFFLQTHCINRSIQVLVYEQLVLFSLSGITVTFSELKGENIKFTKHYEDAVST